MNIEIYFHLFYGRINLAELENKEHFFFSSRDKEKERGRERWREGECEREGEGDREGERVKEKERG